MGAGAEKCVRQERDAERSNTSSAWMRSGLQRLDLLRRFPSLDRSHAKAVVPPDPYCRDPAVTSKPINLGFRHLPAVSQLLRREKTSVRLHFAPDEAVLKRGQRIASPLGPEDVERPLDAQQIERFAGSGPPLPGRLRIAKGAMVKYYMFSKCANWLVWHISTVAASRTRCWPCPTHR